MASVFTQIVNGELPSYKVAETEKFLAFLAINPLVTGHTLVIPKKEVDNIFDLDDETFIGLHIFSKYVAHAIGQAIPCKRVGVSIIGLEVPHAHIHLVPLNDSGDINFSKEKLNPTKEEFEKTAEVIRGRL